MFRKDKSFFFVNLRSHVTKLLDIPPKVRAKIWIYCGFEETRKLRLLCQEIKEDIDTESGISSAIDSGFKDFPFHCKTAIRKATILELVKPPLVEFLKYPLVLEELVIKGEISKQNFIYIMKSCPNLHTLNIIFNDQVLKRDIPFFPLPDEVWNVNPLKKLNAVLFSSTTTTFKDITYVLKNTVGFFKESRLDNNRFNDMNIQIHHKFANPLMKEIVAASILFAHKHMSTLKRINLTIKDKDMSASGGTGGAKESSGPAPSPKSASKAKKSLDKSSTQDPKKSLNMKHQSLKSVEKKEHEKRNSGSSNNSGPKTMAQFIADTRSKVEAKRNRRGTEAIGGPVIPLNLMGKENEEDDNTAAVPEGVGEANLVDDLKEEKRTSQQNDVISQTFEFISNNPWPKSERLQQVVLVLSLRVLEKLPEMIGEDTKLILLNLEGYGGTRQNWPVYCAFLQRANPDSMLLITFHHVNYEDDKGNAKPLNFKVFKPFLRLKRLAIFGEKKDDYTKLSRVQNLMALTDRLEEVIIERILLTTLQAFRFLCCFPEMLSVTLEYWSISERQFGLFMLILKWVVRCDCTRVLHINLVETKIKFTSERNRVRALQEAIQVSSFYRDDEATRLFIDTENRSPDEVSVAPAIVFEKITPPQPRPAREKRKKSSGDKGKNPGDKKVGRKSTGNVLQISHPNNPRKSTDQDPSHPKNNPRKSIDKDQSDPNKQIEKSVAQEDQTHPSDPPKTSVDEGSNNVKKKNSVSKKKK